MHDGKNEGPSTKLGLRYGVTLARETKTTVACLAVCVVSKNRIAKPVPVKKLESFFERWGTVRQVRIK